MDETNLQEYLILRNLDEPITEDTFDAAAEHSIEVTRQLAAEGVGIDWKKSDVRTQADGAVTGTMCHFRAENEDVIYEHADRAGLPVTRIDRYGRTLENGSR